jgi:hypothetical protein
MFWWYVTNMEEQRNDSIKLPRTNPLLDAPVIPRWMKDYAKEGEFDDRHHRPCFETGFVLPYDFSHDRCPYTYSITHLFTEREFRVEID